MLRWWSTCRARVVQLGGGQRRPTRLEPPATSTLPSGSSVAAWPPRGSPCFRVAVHVPLAGSYSSADVPAAVAARHEHLAIGQQRGRGHGAGSCSRWRSRSRCPGHTARRRRASASSRCRAASHEHPAIGQQRGVWPARRDHAAGGGPRPVLGSYSSADAERCRRFGPPATSTLPSRSSVAVCPRAFTILPVAVQDPVPGSYSSAGDRAGDTCPVPRTPPATRTLPSRIAWPLPRTGATCSRWRSRTLHWPVGRMDRDGRWTRVVAGVGARLGVGGPTARDCRAGPGTSAPPTASAPMTAAGPAAEQDGVDRGRVQRAGSRRRSRLARWTLARTGRRSSRRRSEGRQQSAARTGRSHASRSSPRSRSNRRESRPRAPDDDIPSARPISSELSSAT